MSDYETHTGKLRRVDLKGLTVEDFFKRRCEEEKIEQNDFHSSWQEVYEYETENYYKYIVVKDTVWEVFEHVRPDSFDGIHIVDNKDGTYSFCTTFYNGGASLGEVLEDAITDL